MVSVPVLFACVMHIARGIIVFSLPVSACAVFYDIFCEIDKSHAPRFGVLANNVVHSRYVVDDDDDGGVDRNMCDCVCLIIAPRVCVCVHFHKNLSHIFDCFIHQVCAMRNFTYCAHDVPNCYVHLPWGVHMMANIHSHILYHSHITCTANARNTLLIIVIIY